MARSMMSRACDISPPVRKSVKKRDKCCIYCGSSYGLQIAHYISRGRGGLGVEQNLSVLCVNCHYVLDNGADSDLRRDIDRVMVENFKKHYPDWDEAKLVFTRW